MHHLARPAARSSRGLTLRAHQHVRQRPQQRPFGLLSWLTGSGSSSASAEDAGTPRPGAGLPPPEEAQQLAVVRLPNFLSEEEIASILQAAADIRRDGAGAVRLQSSPPFSSDGKLPSW